MTDPTPTLTDLRETARMIVDCDIADNRIALARAFLALTDPIMCYQRQLATVIAERDEMKKQKELDDYHILKLQCVLEGSTKRNRHKRETINGLQRKLDELRRELAEIREKIQDAEMEARENRE